MKPVEMKVYVGRDSLSKYVKVLGGTMPLFYLGHLSGWCGDFGEGKGDLCSLLNPGFTKCWDTARQFPGGRMGLSVAQTMTRLYPLSAVTTGKRRLRL